MFQVKRHLVIPNVTDFFADSFAVMFRSKERLIYHFQLFIIFNIYGETGQNVAQLLVVRKCAY